MFEKKYINNSLNDVIRESVNLTEISKKTLGSYVKKAAEDARLHGGAAAQVAAFDGSNAAKKLNDKSKKRITGIAKATDRLVKEESLEENLRSGTGFLHQEEIEKNSKLSKEHKEKAEYHNTIASVSKDKNEKFHHANIANAHRELSKSHGSLSGYHTNEYMKSQKE